MSHHRAAMSVGGDVEVLDEEDDDEQDDQDRDEVDQPARHGRLRRLIAPAAWTVLRRLHRDAVRVVRVTGQM